MILIAALLFYVSIAAAEDELICEHGLILSRCDTGITPTCRNSFFGRPLTKPCRSTCVCPGKDEVYYAEKGICVKQWQCLDLMRLNKACEKKDPNSETLTCLPSRCTVGGACTMDCRNYCSCKDGYILSDTNDSCN